MGKREWEQHEQDKAESCYPQFEELLKGKLRGKKAIANFLGICMTTVDKLRREKAPPPIHCYPYSNRLYADPTELRKWWNDERK